MNTPQPSQTPPAGPKKPLVVVPAGMTRRDMMIAGVILLGVFGFVIGAIYSTGTEKPKNLIKGVIRAHTGNGNREREISLTYKDGNMKAKTVDTGWYLKVFVKEENREYEVMVEKELWDGKKDGETIEFLRPPSEQ